MSRGFTLIEISVVISVLAILSTLGIASFVSFSHKQELSSTVYELSTTINLAKSRAFSQVKPAQCANLPLDGYKIVITPPNSYQMDAVCGGYSFNIKSVTMPKNITSTTYASFFFPVITGGVTGAGTVALTGYGQTKTVTVDSLGNIK